MHPRLLPTILAAALASSYAVADTGKPKFFAAPETARAVSEKIDILELGVTRYAVEGSTRKGKHHGKNHRLS